MSFNEETGAHLVRYASAWKRGMERSTLELDYEPRNDPSLFRFTGLSANLCLLSRRYFIVFRSSGKETKVERTVAEKETRAPDVPDDKFKDIFAAVGSRVESCVAQESKWEVLTLVDASCGHNKKQQGDIRLTLISDEGEVYDNVTPAQVRLDDSSASARERTVPVFSLFSWRANVVKEMRMRRRCLWSM
jgi:hypothetical protein